MAVICGRAQSRIPMVAKRVLGFQFGYTEDCIVQIRALGENFAVVTEDRVRRS